MLIGDPFLNKLLGSFMLIPYRAFVRIQTILLGEICVSLIFSQASPSTVAPSISWV
jgi:hypothetical protein